VITRDLRRSLARAVAAAGFEQAADPGLRPTGIPGRYAASVALALGANPRETAGILAGTLVEEDWIRTAEVTGPGYLTITVTPEALAAVADNITAEGPACVTSNALTGVTVPAAPRGDPLTAPTWEKARTALAARLTARLAAAAGATVAELASPERKRLTLPAHPSSSEPPERVTEVSPATSGPLSRTVTPERVSPGTPGVAPAPPGQAADLASSDDSVPFPRTAPPPSPASRHFTNSGDGTGVSRTRSEDSKTEPDAEPQSRETDVARAVAFAGRDAITFTLARAIPGKLLRVDPEIIARHVLSNPAYAVRYAHARAASGVRWAASSQSKVTSDVGASPGEMHSSPEVSVPVGGSDTMAVFAIGPARRDIGGYGGSSPREISAEFEPDTMAVSAIGLEPSAGSGGSSPRGATALLDALSWLPERVATAARRGRPDEFARYLEDLASVTIDVLSSASHPGSAGPDWAAAPGSDRLALALALAAAARTGLAAGLGLLEVSAPDRL